jgi:phage tail-like protein
VINPEFKTYCFKDREHWRAGVFDQLQATDGGELRVTAGFVIEPIPGSGKDDATPALDFDSCHHLYWVRPDSGELVRLHDFGPQSVGLLSEGKEAIRLSMGKERIWLHTPLGIHSYALQSLHPLRQLRRDRNILAMAGDSRDGVWWLEGGDSEKAVLHRADRYGSSESKPIVLPMPLTRAALAASRCGRKLVILDPEVPAAERMPDACGKEKARWRIIIIDCVKNQEPLIYDTLGTIDLGFKPQQLTLDFDDTIHLLDPETTWLWTLDLEGVLLARHRLEVKESSLPLAGIAAGDPMVLATADGIAYLRLAETTGRQDKERESVFITPALISPDGTPHGWQRADIEAILLTGTTLQVKCAATRDSSLASRIDMLLKDATLSSANKIDQIDQRLKWREEDTVTYAGSDEESGATRLRYPLHQIDETHLWLKFTLYTPPRRKPPSIRALSVYYPNLSYLRYLPSVYQENSTSAIQLKSFLAIFETLFGDLDTLIDQLPGNLDPETAPGSWLPFLLRWLGLPSTETMTSTMLRNVLKAAPALLAGRGTHQALQRLLEILVGEGNGRAAIEIDDAATKPLPWILQPKDRSSTSARLGYDTLIVAQPPPAFRLGTARLGKAKGVPLGRGRADLQQILAQHAGELTIRITAEENIRPSLEPVIRIFLPYFVPAHCRYRLEFLPTPRQYWQQRLDVDFRLQDGENFRLGKETVLGRFRLPLSSTEEIMLDRNAQLDSGLHLN